MAKPIPVTDQEFEEKVLKSQEVVMVDFWAPWCGPCRAVAPILDELAKEYEGRVTIAKVNTDENPKYAMQYKVQGIPTMIFFREGKEVDRIVGAGPKAYYKNKLEALLK
ncbi:MAG: thioredoxin [Herpetosiphonaceae bacterium]|nr:MAG: thioredoxin [Herpetosiphonaceae bacterium]